MEQVPLSKSDIVGLAALATIVLLILFVVGVR